MNLILNCSLDILECPGDDHTDMGLEDRQVHSVASLQKKPELGVKAIGIVRTFSTELKPMVGFHVLR